MMTTQVEQLQRQLRQTYLFGFARRVFGTRKIKNEEKKRKNVFPKSVDFFSYEIPHQTGFLLPPVTFALIAGTVI